MNMLWLTESYWKVKFTKNIGLISELANYEIVKRVKVTEKAKIGSSRVSFVYSTLLSSRDWSSR